MGNGARGGSLKSEELSNKKFAFIYSGERLGRLFIDIDEKKTPGFLRE